MTNIKSVFNKILTDNEHIAEKVLNTLIENIPYPLYVKDSKGCYIKTNRRFSEIIVSLSLQKVLGKKSLEFNNYLTPKESQNFLEEDVELHKKPGKKIIEHSLKCADGIIRDYLFVRSTYLEKGASAFGIMCIIIDVTHKRKLSKKLIESENTYRKFLNYVNDPIIIICENDRNIIDANESALKLFGYSNSELINRCNEHITTTPENLKKIYLEKIPALNSKLQIFGNLLISGSSKLELKARGEINLLRSEGIRAIILIRLSITNSLIGFVSFQKLCSSYNRQNSYLSLFGTITELISYSIQNQYAESARKSAEEEMIKLSRAVEQSANIVIIINTEGVIEYVNPKFKNVTGYTFGEVVGKKPSLLKSGETNPDLYSQMLGELKVENQLTIEQKIESIEHLAAGIAHEINTPMQYVDDNSTFLADAFDSMCSYIY